MAKEPDNRPSDPNFANPTNASDGGMPKPPEIEILNAREILSGIYGPGAIYPDIVRIGEGKGIMTVRQEHVGRKGELVFDSLGGDSSRAIGHVKITDDHARGHFSPDSGLPLVLPGHKQIRLAAEATGLLLANRLGEGKKGRLVGFEEITFGGIIRPGDVVDVVSNYSSGDGSGLSSAVSLSVDGVVKTTILGLVVANTQHASTDDSMLPDQLIEFAAQASATELFANNPSARPIFAGIGTAIFSGIEARIGDSLTASTTEGQKNDARKFRASSIIVNQRGEEVARVNDMSGAIIPQNIAVRLLRH